MRRLSLFLLLAMPPLAATAQDVQLPVSAKYPLQAHIVSIEMEQQENHSSGEISTRRLMKTEVDGKTYLLVATPPPLDKRPFERRTWLNTGLYPARRTKHGFEFEYKDGDKVRHEELHISSED
jgi:hypothetical protein